MISKRDIERLKEANDIEGLIKALKHSDEDVRLEAIKALGKIQDKRAVEPLIEMLENENDQIRMHAAEALGEVGDKRSVDPLISMLKDKDWEVGHYAIGPLRKLVGSDKTAEFLIEPLKKEKYKNRIEIVRTLGEIGGERAVKLLIDAYKKDRSEYVRVWVPFALRDIAVDKGEYEYVSKAIKEWIKKMKNRVEEITALKEAIKNKSFDKEKYERELNRIEKQKGTILLEFTRFEEMLEGMEELLRHR